MAGITVAETPAIAPPNVWTQNSFAGLFSSSLPREIVTRTIKPTASFKGEPTVFFKPEHGLERAVTKASSSQLPMKIYHPTVLIQQLEGQKENGPSFSEILTRDLTLIAAENGLAPLQQKFVVSSHLHSVNLQELEVLLGNSVPFAAINNLDAGRYHSDGEKGRQSGFDLSTLKAKFLNFSASIGPKISRQWGAAVQHQKNTHYIQCYHPMFKNQQLGSMPVYRAKLNVMWNVRGIGIDASVARIKRLIVDHVFSLDRDSALGPMDFLVLSSSTVGI
ncbi:hypothetical protein M9H77_17329 [Catharanthus roseus]|uniref:Uncharacterized protein n=1 Tax=Catharanthus roseus TaxID=4058 RepID=A0ACC0B4B6_CATRO|nr:hypothetical protein M9H77_17329 [Catharanthus roseus]